jgi:hypothetical protein
MNSAISDELLDIIAIPDIINYKAGKYYHQIYKTLIVGKDLLPITTASIIGDSVDRFKDFFLSAQESIMNNISIYKSFLKKEKLIDPTIKEKMINNLEEIYTQIKNVKSDSSQTGGRDRRINKKIGQHLIKNGSY